MISIKHQNNFGKMLAKVLELYWKAIKTLEDSMMLNYWNNVLYSYIGIGFLYQNRDFCISYQNKQYIRKLEVIFKVTDAWLGFNLNQAILIHSLISMIYWKRTFLLKTIVKSLQVKNNCCYYILVDSLMLGLLIQEIQLITQTHCFNIWM